ncbi:MAG: VOC family protein [Paracoccaceae bacterium]
MAQKTNPIPKGYRTATPALVVRGAAAAVDYYKSVFGAQELSRHYGDDAATVLRAEIKIGNSILHLADEMPAFGILSPISLGGASGSVQLYLDDLDDAWMRALAAGAVVVLPLEDTYWGERTGQIVDPFGHVWTLSKRVESVSKEEIEKRAAALFAPLPETVDMPQTPAMDAIPTVDIRSIDLSVDIQTAIANGASL